MLPEVFLKVSPPDVKPLSKSITFLIGEGLSAET
jgi:hypothetical protein